MRFQAIEERFTGCDSAALTCHALAARTDGHLLGLAGTPAIPLSESSTGDWSGQQKFCQTQSWPRSTKAGRRSPTPALFPGLGELKSCSCL